MSILVSDAVIRRGWQSEAAALTLEGPCRGRELCDLGLAHWKCLFADPSYAQSYQIDLMHR